MLVVFTGTFSFNSSNRIPNFIYRGMRVKVRNKIPPWFSLPLIKSSAGFGPLDLNDIGELLKVFLFFNSPELKAQVSLPDRLSSVVRLSVRLSVNFSHFHLLLQNHWANFNQTGHIASLGERDSSLFKWKALPFSKGRCLRNSGNALLKFKNLLLQSPTGSISTRLGTTHPLVTLTQGFTIRTIQLSKRRWWVFSFQINIMI